MELHLGKMTSKELADWFNITYNTLRNRGNVYYDKLADYCVFERVYGGIEIKEIFISKYDKTLNLKDKKKYLEEIEACVENQSGLSTISGMARKFEAEGYFESERSGIRRLTKVGKELFGETADLIGHGEVGTREYMWAIKINNFNRYRMFTEEEEKRFDEIIASCYSSNPEKIKKASLLEKTLRDGEIDVKDYFETKDRLGLNSFLDCIQKFKEETGLIVVRCTKHQIVECRDFE